MAGGVVFKDVLRIEGGRLFRVLVLQQLDGLLFGYRLAVYHNNAFHAVGQQGGGKGLGGGTQGIVFENRFAVFVGGVEQGGAERVVFKSQVAAHQFLFEHVGQRGAAVNQRAVVYGRLEDGVGNADFEVGTADGFAVVFGFFGVFKQGF